MDEAVLQRARLGGMKNLGSKGWAIVQTPITDGLRKQLRDTAFSADVAGTRCLLDQPVVCDVALQIKADLIRSGVLPTTANAIQAIAFDKTATTNWKVTWHQDVLFPLARVPKNAAYTLPTEKEGIYYARPPRDVLEEMLAVRLHLDACDATNGPLRVAPGSHLLGILKSTDIPAAVERSGSVACLANEGDALLMKPLLLHASSSATTPKHRRVLHLVYHSGRAVIEPWHRSI